MLRAQHHNEVGSLALPTSVGSQRQLISADATPASGHFPVREQPKDEAERDQPDQAFDCRGL